MQSAPPLATGTPSGSAAPAPAATVTATPTAKYVVTRAARAYTWERPFHAGEIKANASVLMVAEKPSIANSIAEILSRRTHHTQRGVSAGIPVHTFSGTFFNKPAEFVVTSVIGHVFSANFYDEHQVRRPFSCLY